MASLWKMKTDELRDMAVELGANRNELYGTSKQAIIIKIHKLQEEAKNNTTTEITDNTDNKEEITMANTTTAKTKKPRAKKSTKTTKKAAEPTTVTVVLKAFTGMKIAIYTGKLNEKEQTITITTKAGKNMEFNLDGTQKVTDNRANNSKFNNRIEITTEA